MVKPKSLGIKCPDCGEGEILEKRSRRGKVFYSCNRYPSARSRAGTNPSRCRAPPATRVRRGEDDEARRAPSGGASKKGARAGGGGVPVDETGT